VRLAVIVPMLDRAPSIEASLRALAPLRARGHRVVVADGGSRDDGPARAAALADRVVRAPRDWALQIDAGARTPEADTADALLFLPERLRLPPDADREVARALGGGASPWGFFDLRLCPAPAGPRSDSFSLRLASALAQAGSRASGIGLADQAIFVTRAAFLALEGLADADGAPDVDFCRRARLLGSPLLLRVRADLATEERRPAAILGRAARRECWRLACALNLPWQPQPPPRWSPI
jgi:hypothetical protein